MGNGQKINIWDDVWIPNSPTRLAITRHDNQLLSKVADLIDPISGNWDEHLVRLTLWPVDVERVLQIPLPNFNLEDFVAWELTKSGTFSVRSAYHAEWSANYAGRSTIVDGQGSAHDCRIWKIMWSLKVPAKIKIFIWKSLHGALPCKAVLADRHIKTSAQCPMCLNGAEDIRHLLFLCPRARWVWNELGILPEIDKACLVDRAGSSILEFLLLWPFKGNHTLGLGPMPESIAIAAWFLWWDRRNFVHEQKLQKPEASAMSIKVLISNFTKACSSKASPKRNGWSKPPEGMVKLNVDAAFNSDDLSGAVAAVIRDEAGHFVAGANERINWCADAHIAETLALKFGLNLALSIGCFRVLVSGDNLQVIETMVDGVPSSALAAAVYDDCFHLSDEFVIIGFEHCAREANCVAHELAKLARFSDQGIWLDDPPLCIVPFLVSDVTLLNDQ